MSPINRVKLVLCKLGINIVAYSLLIIYTNYLFSLIKSTKDFLIIPIIIVFSSFFYGASLIFISSYNKLWFLRICFAIFILMTISIACIAVLRVCN